MVTHSSALAPSTTALARKPSTASITISSTIYTDPTGALTALYIDSEGHVINYMISTPDATTAIFTSQGPAAAPHFKLIYHFDGKVMTGKFQGAAPGSTDFHSYLEWSGPKQ